MEGKDKWDVVRAAYFREQTVGVKMESIHSLTFGSNVKEKEATGNFKYNDQSEEIILGNQPKKHNPSLVKLLQKFKTFDVSDNLRTVPDTSEEEQKEFFRKL